MEAATGMKLSAAEMAVLSRLLDEAPAALHRIFDSNLKYALLHRDIITRFGRFPHRNQALGRGSTPEEVEWLDTEGSDFDQ